MIIQLSFNYHSNIIQLNATLWMHKKHGNFIFCNDA